MPTERVTIEFKGKNRASRMLRSIERETRSISKTFRGPMVQAMRQSARASEGMVSSMQEGLRRIADTSQEVARDSKGRFVKAGEGIEKSSAATTKKVAGHWRGLGAKFKGIAKGLRKTIGRALAGISPSLGYKGGNLLAGLLGRAGSAIGQIGANVGGGTNPFTGLIKMANSAVRATTDAVVSIATSVTGAVRKGIDVVLGGIQMVTKFIPLFGTAISGLTSVVRNVVGVVGGIFQGLIGLVGGVFKAVVGTAATVLNGLLTVATKIVSGIASAFGKLVGFVGGIFGKILSKVGLVGTAIFGVMTAKSMGFRKQMARAFGLIAADLKAAGADGAQTMRREFVQIARDVLKDAGSLKWADVGKAVYDTVSGRVPDRAGGEADPGRPPPPRRSAEEDPTPPPSSRP